MKQHNWVYTKSRRGYRCGSAPTRQTDIFRIAAVCFGCDAFVLNKVVKAHTSWLSNDLMTACDVLASLEKKEDADVD